MNSIQYLKITKNFNLINFTYFIFSLLIIATLLDKWATVAYVASILLIFISLYFLIFKRNMFFYSSLKQIVNERKIFILFNIWCLISISLFTYANFSSESLTVFYKNWRFILVIFFYCLVFQLQNERIKQTVNCSMVICLGLVLFIYPYLLFDQLGSQPFYIALRNQLGKYIPIFFPFVLSSYFYYKSICTKTLMLILIGATFFFLSYTGFRGAILAIVTECIIVLFYFSKDMKSFFTRLFIFGGILILLIFIAYKTIPQFKQKVDQTIGNHNISSSRDLIIKDRFPLIMNSEQHVLIGIGYGSVSYNQYLLDHDALKAGGIGGYTKNGYIYNNDEPFFLTIFYNVGIVGLMLYLASFFICLHYIHKNIKFKKDIFNVSFMAFGIGYFLIFCSFELTSMRLFFLFCILSTLCSRANNKTLKGN